MGRGTRKAGEPSQKKTRLEEEEDDGGDDAVVETEGQEKSEKLEDGLAFWVASKTISFQVNELESYLKKAMLTAGFTVEECSVSQELLVISFKIL